MYVTDQTSYRRHQSSSSPSNPNQITSKSESSPQRQDIEKGNTTTYTIKQSTKEIIIIQDRVKIIPIEDGIVNVQLSRPSKLNSLDIPMFESIADAASRLRNDTTLSKNLRAVIISGEGRAFCTGLDAKSVALSGPSKALTRLLERPSEFGGEVSNLAQDVCYLWR